MGVIVGAVVQTMDSRQNLGYQEQAVLSLVSNIIVAQRDAALRMEDLGFYIEGNTYLWKKRDTDQDDPFSAQINWIPFESRWSGPVNLPSSMELSAQYSLNASTSRSIPSVTTGSQSQPLFVVRSDGELVPPMALRFWDSTAGVAWLIELDGIHAPEWRKDAS